MTGPTIHGLTMTGLTIHGLTMTVLLAACTAPSAHPSAAPGAASHCADGHDELAIQPSPGVLFAPGDPEAARTWKAPPTLGLAVAPPVIEGRSVKLVAVLSNQGPGTIDAFTLAGGMTGFSTNPVSATLKAPLRPTPPVQAVEQFPMPERITLPPGARITYELHACLDRYVVAAGQVVAVDWSFELWTGRKTGTASVTVP